MPNGKMYVKISGFIYNPAQDKFLIVRRNPNLKVAANKWELPGGKLEAGENDLEHRLVEEVLEETNLKIKPCAPYNAYIRYSPDKERKYLVLTYTTKVLDESVNVKLSEEHTNYAWADVDVLDDYDIEEEEKKAMLKGYKLMH